MQILEQRTAAAPAPGTVPLGVGLPVPRPPSDPPPTPAGTHAEQAEHTDSTSARLWAAYRAERDPKLREQLIVHHAPLVKYVAGRVGSGLPAQVELDDLISWGTFGLLEAVDRFDPDRGTAFSRYAMSRIRGAMLDGLRSTDWAPRRLRHDVRRFDEAVACLYTRLQRTPTEVEVAGQLGATVAQVRELLAELPSGRLLALDELLAADGAPVRLVDTLAADTADPLTELEVGETRQLLARAIGLLPPRERTLVGLYYFEHLTLSEIGRVFGVTESRVCQMHGGAVRRLRRTLVDVLR